MRAVQWGKCAQIQLDLSYHVGGYYLSANVFTLADFFYFGGVRSSMRFGGIAF